MRGLRTAAAKRERQSQKDFFKNVLLFDIYLSKVNGDSVIRKTDHHITILTNSIREQTYPMGNDALLKKRSIIM